MKREHAMKLRAAIVKASASLTDEDAVQSKELFAPWKAGEHLFKGDRRRYGGYLWNIEQEHDADANYPPSIYTASLYSQIPEPGQGETPDNPIYYNNNMKLEKGKYYSQNDVVYVCTLGTGVPVYNDLSALVGLYVEVYNP